MHGAQVITSLLVILVIMHGLLLGVSYLILLERKLASWSQDRIGPNRVGLWFKIPGLPRHLWGLGQPIADGLKMLMKEDYTPGNVDRGLFLAAPVLAVIPAMIGWAVIPWGGVFESFPGFEITFWNWLPLIGGDTWQVLGGAVAVAVADLNVGAVYILAVGSLAVYGVVLGAWAANNKYTFFGGIRAAAQMLSYEIPMGLCVLCVLLLAGSASASDIIGGQVGYWGLLPKWYVFQQPLAAILFFICILAESNRAPFDLAECEQELIGGFHTEYSSMKFGLFFLGEYIHMITASAFLSLLFLGGWHLPFVDYILYGGAQTATGVGESGLLADLVGAGAPLWLMALLGMGLKVLVFVGKCLVLVAIMMWIRWTLPRFRFDQLMGLAWRGLIPVTLLLLLVTGYCVYRGWEGYMWLANILVLAVVMLVIPWIPRGIDVNRRVGLSGSRFSPATGAD
ncbi:MAG: NADH-quinone oxidoreductase subunit H [Phycisphaerae bacterium]|nr:NADH-quinone oxidoreductase subunit H [Phycisphaerae bacterium]